MAIKGYIDTDAKILADNMNAPYIRDEGGITDTVSTHIADIIEDNAEEIFGREETQEAIDGTAVLIATITLDDETLSYIINNLDYRHIVIKAITNNPISDTTLNCEILYNNISMFTTPLFGTTIGFNRYLFDLYLADMRIPVIGPLHSAGYGNLTVRNSRIFTSRIRCIDTITINLPINMVGNTIEIWGVK